MPAASLPRPEMRVDQRIDHLVTTHWHRDHVGAMALVARQLPIGEFIDHGANVQPDPVIDAFLLHTYPQMYRNSRHTVVKPGDTIPLAGVDVRVFGLGGEIHWNSRVRHRRPESVLHGLQAWKRCEHGKHPIHRAPVRLRPIEDTLGREILIENPTHYLALRDHQWSETSFLAELARRSGCRLLIDINNVAVGAHNLAFDAAEWLEAIPAKLVGEIHLAGHMLDAEGTLLIDSHDAPVSHDVWQLYESFIARSGPMPTLIERDGNLPPFADLMAERDRAQAVIRGVLDVAA